MVDEPWWNRHIRKVFYALYLSRSLSIFLAESVYEDVM